MMKTMTRGPVRYSPGVLFLCQWPYRALPEQEGKQGHVITVLLLVLSPPYHGILVYLTFPCFHHVIVQLI